MSEEENETEYLKLLVFYLCESPSNILGMNKIKGTIEIGKQADLLVFDHKSEKII